jgi:hypothetical protein
MKKKSPNTDMSLFDKNFLKYANQLTNEQMMIILQTIKYHLNILVEQSEKYRLEYEEKHKNQVV